MRLKAIDRLPEETDRILVDRFNVLTELILLLRNVEYSDGHSEGNEQHAVGDVLSWTYPMYHLVSNPFSFRARITRASPAAEAKRR